MHRPSLAVAVVGACSATLAVKLLLVLPAVLLYRSTRQFQLEGGVEELVRRYGLKLAVVLQVHEHLVEVR